MISVVIPTLDAEATLPQTLAALVPAAAEGLVRDVVVADGGSRDATSLVADGMGCSIVSAQRGRGSQLAAGAAVAKGPWLLFLHADTVLGEGWTREAEAFIERTEREGRGHERAAAFRFALDSYSTRARALEVMVGLRCTLLALPYGNQGLLISKRFYDNLGGYRPVPLMEDVDLVRRIGRRRLVMLRSPAVSSAARYEGMGRRSLRNLSCLAMYYVGVDPARIAERYQA